MLLEDDVWIRGDLTTMNCIGAICGVTEGRPWNHIQPALSEFINQHGQHHGDWLWFGASGGCVFNRQAFLDSFDYGMEVMENNWEKISAIGAGWTDIALTVLFNLSGHEYHGNPEHAERRYDSDWETSGKKIVHDYKVLYPPGFEERPLAS
jgi:hypothetical protein